MTNQSMSEKPHHSNNFIWDLSKATLTALALIGATGCESKSTSEIIAERPVATPNQIVANSDQWIGKQVSIYADPTLIDDRSTFRITSGRYGHTYVDLDVRYKIELSEPVGENKSLNVDQHGSIDVCNKSISFKDLSAPYRLREQTTVVSGTVKKYSNSETIYLDVDRSLYKDK